MGVLVMMNTVWSNVVLCVHVCVTGGGGGAHTRPNSNAAAVLSAKFVNQIGFFAISCTARTQTKASDAPLHTIPASSQSSYSRVACQSPSSSQPPSHAHASGRIHDALVLGAHGDQRVHPRARVLAALRNRLGCGGSGVSTASTRHTHTVLVFVFPCDL